MVTPAAVLVVVAAALVVAQWLLPVATQSIAGASGGAVSVDAARPRTTTTTVPPTTAPPTTQAPTTAAPTTAAPTTSPRPATTVPALEERVTESARATTRLNRVVIGLLVLAVLIAAATVFFWVRTRPGSAARRSSAVIVVGADGTEVSLADAVPAGSGPIDLASSGSSAAVADPDNPWHVAPAPELPATGHVAARDSSMGVAESPAGPAAGAPDDVVT